jgi:hypothetical protein
MLKNEIIKIIINFKKKIQNKKNSNEKNKDRILQIKNQRRMQLKREFKFYKLFPIKQTIIKRTRMKTK